MIPMNTTDMTPVEIDTVLSENYNQQMLVEVRIAAEVRHLESVENALVRRPSEYNRDLVLKTRECIKALQEQRMDLIAASAPYLGEYSRRPWNRYFLVKNVNGHVHRGMKCSTCFIDTQYGWLVELADCDEDAMVEEWGERACTVCFPEAPTNPLYNRPARIDREAREAKDAEKAAKDAAKVEKAITDVDGSVLKVGGEVLRTKVAARNRLSGLLSDIVFYGTDHPSDFVAQVRQLVLALQAAGLGEGLAAQADRAIKKAVKDSKVPNHNPFGLSQEQILAAIVETKANVATARALVKEVIG
jgi:hypothetical protein